jgi:hypothetical protein
MPLYRQLAHENRQLCNPAGGQEGVLQSLVSAISFDAEMSYDDREAILVEGMLRSIVNSQVRKQASVRGDHLSIWCGFVCTMRWRCEEQHWHATAQHAFELLCLCAGAAVAAKLLGLQA